MGSSVLLVNPNRMRPPIAPLGIDLLGTALERAGLHVEVCDLQWSKSPETDLARALLPSDPLLVALTVRNINDSSMATRGCFLDEYAAIVRIIRAHTDAPVVAGGAGFSISPAAALRELGADFAVWGEGERSLVELALSLSKGKPPEHVPGLMGIVGTRREYTTRHETDGRRRKAIQHPTVVSPQFLDLSSAPAPRRTFVDNARYLAEGAQVGFETSRGCDRACTYCADPLLKGRTVRRRDPDSVAEELEHLLAAGVDCLHTCDSEFNADVRGALDVCDAIYRHGLGGRIRWYAYCAVTPFSGELARAMRAAGCVGINFGADHTDDALLARLGRRHRLQDIKRARGACRENGIACMFDLLLGAPGETRGTVRSVLAAMRALDPEAVGVALGIGLYRGTALGDELVPPSSAEATEGLAGPPGPGRVVRTSVGPDRPGVVGSSPDLLRPAFYLAPELGDDAPEWLAREIRGDARFLYFGGGGEESPAGGSLNYNYNANAELERAIAAGARGAYWDILRKLPRPTSG
jgi:hypothetical protein